MKKFFLVAVVASFAVLMFAGISFAADTSDIAIENHSDMSIHHLFLSPIDKEQWGSDQLQDHAIDAGKGFVLHGVPCDHYDAKLVDEDGEECILGGVDICGQSQTWVITGDALAHCQEKTDENKDDDDKDDDD